MTKEDEFDESSKAMIDSIGKMLKSNERLLKDNPKLPIILTSDLAVKLRTFIEHGYTGAVGGPSMERQRMWNEALSILEQIVNQMEAEEPPPEITITIQETQINDLETLVFNSEVFGISPDQKLDTTEVLFTVSDLFTAERAKTGNEIGNSE
jgi:hypothetical protein